MARMGGRPVDRFAKSAEVRCKKCGSLFDNVNSMLIHIRDCDGINHNAIQPHALPPAAPQPKKEPAPHYNKSIFRVEIDAFHCACCDHLWTRKNPFSPDTSIPAECPFCGTHAWNASQKMPEKNRTGGYRRSLQSVLKENPNLKLL